MFGSRVAVYSLAALSLLAHLMDQPRRIPLGIQLTIFSFTRGVISTGHRMVYPFLPVLARAVGVDLESMALVVTARSSVGLFGPFLGSLGDRVGRKVAVFIGLGLFIVGLLIVVIWPSYASILVGFMFGGVGKTIFDPALQAYLGDRVDYNQRRRAVAITELGWSGSSLIGLPIVGWVIARSGWVAPFPLLVLLGIGAAAALWHTLPSDRPDPSLKITLPKALRTILTHPVVLSWLAINLLIHMSYEAVAVIYGAWMENSFGLQVAALGATSIVIGLAELGGEGTVAGLTDRISMRQAISVGIAGSALACLSLPILSSSLTGAMVWLFIFFITFEFTFIIVISLMTELVPNARATLLATNITAGAGGRAIGAMLGPALFKMGLVTTGLTTAALVAAAFVIMRVFTRIK